MDSARRSVAAVNLVANLVAATSASSRCCSFFAATTFCTCLVACALLTAVAWTIFEARRQACSMRSAVNASFSSRAPLDLLRLEGVAFDDRTQAMLEALACICFGTQAAGLGLRCALRLARGPRLDRLNVISIAYGAVFLSLAELGRGLGRAWYGQRGSLVGSNLLRCATLRE
eukprot:scaffold269401_cov31-Tisochrysis_lutea.AAC.1